jgi:hypothetical protein
MQGIQTLHRYRKRRATKAYFATISIDLIKLIVDFVNPLEYRAISRLNKFFNELYTSDKRYFLHFVLPPEWPFQPAQEASIEVLRNYAEFCHLNDIADEVRKTQIHSDWCRGCYSWQCTQAQYTINVFKGTLCPLCRAKTTYLVCYRKAFLCGQCHRYLKQYQNEAFDTELSVLIRGREEYDWK